MICQHCDSQTKVIRSKTEAGQVTRRRQCGQCGRRFNTTETPDDQTYGLEAKVRRIMNEAQELIDEAIKR